MTHNKIQSSTTKDITSMNLQINESGSAIEDLKITVFYHKNLVMD